MSNKKDETDLLLDHLFRHESGKLFSVLTRIFGTENLDLVEDVVQDSLLEAVVQWKFKGVPENPLAWLIQVSKNKALNILNRKKQNKKFRSDSAYNLVSKWVEETSPDHVFSDQEILDDQLRMIFTCCHPSVSSDAQIALALKTLCGFSIQEIAKAFLTNEEIINKRLVRARQKLRENKVSFNVPSGKNLEKRLSVVLTTIYLLFNEGYSASSGEDLIRQDFCEESIRLTEILCKHGAIGQKSHVYALLSLMQLNSSRFKSRLSSDGCILTLSDQDRSLWSQELITAGLMNLEKSASANEVSIYHILATISAYHCAAADFESTDWNKILSLYDNLIKLDNSPIVLLNRAIALSKVKGPVKGIAELDLIREIPAIKTYPLYYSTQAAFYIDLNEYSAAAASLETAIRLSPLLIEKELLQKRLLRCNEKIN